jgi:hypothetical protein
MSQPVNLSEDEEIERKFAAIRTALYTLAFSLVVPLMQYFWQQLLSKPAGILSINHKERKK